VIPAAGLGTRLLSITGGAPKEMLPLGGKPLIWHGLREAMNAGFEKALVVVSKAKVELIEYLDSADLPIDVVTVMQPSPAGIGDAVLWAAESAGAPFGVLLPDDVTHSRTHWERLRRVHEATGSAAMCLRRVPPETAHRFGIASCRREGDLLRIVSLVEKPPPGTSPSNLAIFGRYFVTSAVVDALATLRDSSPGELQLTDGFAAEVDRAPGVFGVLFSGRIYDNGTAEEYRSSIARYPAPSRRAS
jgi:UTP--glucose-1-phosphate uridylyltransferase